MKTHTLPWPLFLLLLACMPLASCADKVCLYCDGACPDLVGKYLGQLYPLADRCEKADLTTGEFSLDVLAQTDDATTQETGLRAQVTTREGTWAVYHGSLCNTENAEEPKEYAFQLSYNPSVLEDGLRSEHHSVSGAFIVEGGALDLSGTYTIDRFDDEGNYCSMVGTLALAKSN